MQKWWGLKAALQSECRSHFLQFSGLIGGTLEQVAAWDMVWLAAIWSIWSARNVLIFKGKKHEIGEIVEAVKLKSWLWITARRPTFCYPVSNWCSNPTGCHMFLKLFGWVV